MTATGDFWTDVLVITTLASVVAGTIIYAMGRDSNEQRED